MIWYLVWVYLNFILEIRYVIDVWNRHLTSVMLCRQLIQIADFLLYSDLWGALDVCCVASRPRLLPWAWTTATLAQVDSVISFQHICLSIPIGIPVLRLLRFISERSLTYPPIRIDGISASKLLLAQRIILRIMRQSIVHIVFNAVFVISWCIGLRMKLIQLVLFQPALGLFAVLCELVWPARTAHAWESALRIRTLKLWLLLQPWWRMLPLPR